MVKKQAGTYETMLKQYNKDYSPQITCECGKITTEKHLEKHKQTGVHNILMYYKKQRDDILNGVVEPEKPKKTTYMNQWNKVNGHLKIKKKQQQQMKNSNS